MSTAMKKEYSKAKKVLHPNSRKTIAIAKRTKKITNREKAKMGGIIKQNLVGEKMIWLKENMVPDVCPYTPELTARLLESYIARHDDELEQITIKRSVGGKRIRQHASREDIVRMSKEREQEEYDTCGIEIPDILIIAQCKMLREWNGELNLLPNFKFRRFGKKHLEEALKKASKPAKEPKKKVPSSTQKSVSDKVDVIQRSEEKEIEKSEEHKEQFKSTKNDGAMEID